MSDNRRHETEIARSADTGHKDAILDPDLPIIDAHHHLWSETASALAELDRRNDITAQSVAATLRRFPRYLSEEFTADITTGHNVVATVYCEAGMMYRLEGPDNMKSVGEVEVANGIAVMAASSPPGRAKLCAGIVGGIDLQLGEKVEEVLIAHIEAGGGRYRGVRTSILYDEDQNIVEANPSLAHILTDRNFRAGFGRLSSLGLSFDALVLEPQIPQLIDLAHGFPDTQIILDHVGGVVRVGRYAGHDRFSWWRRSIRELGKCNNVSIKLGGLGGPFAGFTSCRGLSSAPSSGLAEEWRPYIETCIEAFGVERCMFESNFPIDASVGTYRAVWNAFKRIVAWATLYEKQMLFCGTAAAIYRLDI